MQRHSYRSRYATPTATASAAASMANGSVVPTTTPFPNTAKLPIEVVKNLIAAVERRPNLWIKSNLNGQKRSDITPLWYDVSKDVNLPVDICRIKWGHLRDNFRKVYIRNNLTDATPTTWRFYNDMRFMEKPVAENILAQRKVERKPIFWPSLQKIVNTNDISVPICELNEGSYYERDLNQPSFSDITSFFDDSQSSSSKRFKYETSPDNIKNHNNNNNHTLNNNNNNDLHCDITAHATVDCKESTLKYEIKQNTRMSQDFKEESSVHMSGSEELNDDDFDEDAATDENDNEPLENNDIKPNVQQVAKGQQQTQVQQQRLQQQANTMTTNSAGIFTIEVLDDDDDDNGVDYNSKKRKLIPGSGGVPRDTASKGMTVEASTNTQRVSGLSSDGDSNEEEPDADRMFLLSLLPFIQKLDDRRKLIVRQKLQNVLIEEFR